jgi:hypothetical protein
MKKIKDEIVFNQLYQKPIAPFGIQITPTQSYLLLTQQAKFDNNPGKYERSQNGYRQNR